MDKRACGRRGGKIRVTLRKSSDELNRFVDLIFLPFAEASEPRVMRAARLTASEVKTSWSPDSPEMNLCW